MKTLQNAFIIQIKANECIKCTRKNWTCTLKFDRTLPLVFSSSNKQMNLNLSMHIDHKDFYQSIQFSLLFIFCCHRNLTSNPD